MTHRPVDPLWGSNPPTSVTEAVERNVAQTQAELVELVRQVVTDFDCQWHPHRDVDPCNCSLARLGRFARQVGIVDPDL